MVHGNQRNRYHTTQHFISNLGGVLIIIPLAPYLCRFIPPVMVGQFNIDLLIAVVAAIVIVRLMTWMIRPMVIPALLLICAVLLYNQLNDQRGYNFANIISGYKLVVAQNWDVREQKQTDQLSFNPHLFEDARERTSRVILEKVHYKDSVVRNFSVKHSLDYFDQYHYKYREIARYLSLFRYINTNFKYVPDAQRDEYYATAEETIRNGMGGDCDDHSILMASCMMSIGAQCRLVIVEGHMYPELYVGDIKDFEVMQQAIIQLFGNEGVEKIFYHENDGAYWINLDYTASYPGGPYMNDKVKLLINIP